MSTILVADVPGMDARYLAALPGAELVFTRTMREARAALEQEGWKVVIVGVYFDDSRMFDLVRTIRGDELHNEVPIVCVRGTPGFTSVATHTIEMAVKALSADAFVDLPHLADEAAREAALRAAVEPYLGA